MYCKPISFLKNLCVSRPPFYSVVANLSISHRQKIDIVKWNILFVLEFPQTQLKLLSNYLSCPYTGKGFRNNSLVLQ